MCKACKGKGYLLVDVDSTGKLAIERCDACDHFTSDNAAVEAVVSMADCFARSFTQNTVMPYRMEINNAAIYILDHNPDCTAREDVVTIFEVATVLSVTHCKEKEEIVGDIIAAQLELRGPIVDEENEID